MDPQITVPREEWSDLLRKVGELEAGVYASSEERRARALEAASRVAVAVVASDVSMKIGGEQAGSVTAWTVMLAKRFARYLETGE